MGDRYDFIEDVLYDRGVTWILCALVFLKIIATMVSRQLEHDSIDTVDFTREGIDIHEGRETAVMKSLHVGVAMIEDVDFISERANLNQLFEIFRTAKRSFYFPVVDDLRQTHRDRLSSGHQGPHPQRLQRKGRTTCRVHLQPRRNFSHP